MQHLRPLFIIFLHPSSLSSPPLLLLDLSLPLQLHFLLFLCLSKRNAVHLSSQSRQPAAFQLELINVDTGARTKGLWRVGVAARIVYNWHVREADVQSCALVIEIAF